MATQTEEIRLLQLMEAAWPAPTRQYKLRRMLRKKRRRPHAAHRSRGEILRMWIIALVILALVVAAIIWLVLPSYGRHLAKELSEDIETSLALLTTPAEVQAAYETCKARQTLLGLDVSPLLCDYDPDAAFARLPLFRPPAESAKERMPHYQAGLLDEAEGDLRDAAKQYLLSRGYASADTRFARAVRAVEPEWRIDNSLTKPAAPASDLYLIEGRGYIARRNVRSVLPLRTGDSASTQSLMLLLRDGSLVTASPIVNVAVAGWSGVEEVAQLYYGGGWHILARREDGSYLSTDPGLQSFLREDFAQISVGPRHVAALRHDGTVTTYGSREYGVGEVGNWQGAVSVAAGKTCTAALLSDGTVVAVGADLPLIGSEIVAFGIAQMAVYTHDGGIGDDFLLLDANGRLRDTGKRFGLGESRACSFFRLLREGGKLRLHLYLYDGAQSPYKTFRVDDKS